MKDYTEILGIDKEAAQTLAMVYAGHARAIKLDEKPSSSDLHWLASAFLIAALYQLLTEPAEARDLFSQAAHYYRLSGRPIWRVCEICSNSLVEEGKKSDEDLEYQSTEEQFYTYLQRLYKMGRMAIDKPTLPGRIPELDIPYTQVWDVLNDIVEGAISNNEFRSDRFRELMSRLSEFTLLQQRDNPYWYDLQGQVIPFEPAALAIAVVIVRLSLRQGAYFVGSLIRVSELPKTRSFLLDIAADLFGLSI